MQLCYNCLLVLVVGMFSCFGFLLILCNFLPNSHTICKHRHFFFFSIYIPSISFCTELIRTSSMMWKGKTSLFHSWSYEETTGFFSLNMMLAIDFLYMFFIMLKELSLYSLSCWECFLVICVGFCQIQSLIWSYSCSSLAHWLWWITLVDFWILYQPCICPKHYFKMVTKVSAVRT